MSGSKPDGGSWARCTFGFEPPLDAATRDLLINLEIGDAVTTAAVAVPPAARPARNRGRPIVGRNDGKGRVRGTTRRRTTICRVSCPTRSSRWAPTGCVAGRALVFLSAERRGRTWVLRHFSARDQPMYSPLYDCDLQLDFDGTEVVARHFGGGTAGLGFVYAHVFETPDLPERMVVRRPATDGGPPLVEVELCARPALPRESKL